MTARQIAGYCRRIPACVARGALCSCTGQRQANRTACCGNFADGGRTLSHHSWAELGGDLSGAGASGAKLDRPPSGAEGNRFDGDFPAGCDGVGAALEQLLVYFLYRQTPLALDDGEYEGRAAFAVLSFAMIRRLLLVYFALHGSVVLADLIEIARQYSAEIEYSDENVEILLYRIQEAL